MSVKESIERKLTAALSPTRLTVVDDSGRHAGHHGARPEGETHFDVVVVASCFEGKPRVERQRMVYALLADEMKAGLHALALKTLTPGEAASSGS